MTDHETDAVNKAAQALGLGLAGMTWERWKRLSLDQRAKLRSTAGLTKQLIGYENSRVEVVTDYGETRRFWVSISAGWTPVHIERKRIDSSGGMAAETHYESVRQVRTVADYNPRRMK